MDDTTILKDLYESAAPEIKRLLADDNKITAIGKKHNLTDTQSSQLYNEIIFVLLGLEPLSGFRSSLKQELGVTYDQAIKISADANEQIFGSVIDILNAAKEIESTESSTAAPELLLPDHEQITKTDGPHMHSQNVMPAKPAAVSAAAPKPLSQPVRAAMTVAPVVSAIKPVVSAAPTKPVAPAVPATPAFKSIVDQKLSGMVRSSNAPANLPMSEKDLAEMMKKSEGVTMGGYKGIDPYREPIE